MSEEQHLLFSAPLTELLLGLADDAFDSNEERSDLLLEDLRTPERQVGKLKI